MSKHHIVVLGALVAATLAGCSSTPPAPAVTITATVTAPAPTVTVTASPSTMPAAGLRPLGTGYEAIGDAGIAITYTVYQTQDVVPLPNAQLPSSNRYFGVLAGICNRSTKTTIVGWSPWSVQDAAGGNYPAASSEYEGTPKPEYPFEHTVGAGSCVRGWLLTEVPKNVHPTQVTVGTAAIAPAHWRV